MGQLLLRRRSQAALQARGSLLRYELFRANECSIIVTVELAGLCRLSLSRVLRYDCHEQEGIRH